jgi:hypothetical protein
MEFLELLGVGILKKPIDNQHSTFKRRVVDDIAPKIKKPLQVAKC